jgi:hypothetical protein
MDDPTGLKRTGNGMRRGALDPEREPPFLFLYLFRYLAPLGSHLYGNLCSPQRLRDLGFL